jgi:hypothetical protein
MTKKRGLILLCFFSFIVSLLFVSPIHAQYRSGHGPLGEDGEGVNLGLNLEDLLKNIPKGKGVIDMNSLTIEGIVSALIPFIYVLAGLALLLMLIVGGFQLMMSAGDPKGVESGRNKVMYALIGFLIIFVSYWLVQILQVVFGLPKIF